MDKTLAEIYGTNQSDDDQEKLAAAEPSDEELATYSENVQKRLKQLQHAVHDQRRAAETAEREREAVYRSGTRLGR